MTTRSGCRKGRLVGRALPSIEVFAGAASRGSRARSRERRLSKLRGGLGVSVILVGGLLAASTGIVGATVVAMGMIALPAMLRNGYSRPLACGVVCTAGTLGQIIPPSTLLIILSDVMSNAYQQAQYEKGLFTIDTISVGQTFAAALVPVRCMPMPNTGSPKRWPRKR